MALEVNFELRCSRIAQPLTLVQHDLESLTDQTLQSESLGTGYEGDDLGGTGYSSDHCRSDLGEGCSVVWGGGGGGRATVVGTVMVVAAATVTGAGLSAVT